MNIERNFNKYLCNLVKSKAMDNKVAKTLALYYHIDYLSDKFEGEVKRTQKNSQYDIDRINTFLAIGIGLLAINRWLTSVGY